jgi:parvulin-like peptidyl-prolyl isomerase
MSAATPHRYRMIHLALLSAVLAWGCARGHAVAPAVTLNGEGIPYSDFETYLKASFGDEAPPRDDAETLSRLLDQFIEERLLLQKAEEQRLTVGDEQVDAFLSGLGGGPGSGKRDDPALREQVRRDLLIQEFKDQVLLKDLKVAPEETEAYFREHPAEFQQSRVIVLRQILLEEASEAKRIGGELRADPARFSLLAQRASLSPDKGEPRSFQEEELPQEVRQAVASLAPGQVSGEVVGEGKFRFFQVVDRKEAKSQSLEEARQRIEVLLMQQKAESALARTLQEARRASTVQVHRANLPFPYQGEVGG